jgi:hypothetical protein
VDFGFLDRGGVIMQGIELVVTATLCLASGGLRISAKNSCPSSAETNVLVRGQSMIVFNFS